MARKTFFSFHYVPDNWRASQVRNMGVIEGNAPAKDNDWETITKGGDAAIKKWISEQMQSRTAFVVLIGKATAGRKWINYEIEKAWNDGKGVVGVYIHGLKDVSGAQSSKGSNPFSGFTVGASKTPMDQIVKCYDPPFTTSTYVYNHIKENLATWIDEAIDIRKKY